MMADRLPARCSGFYRTETGWHDCGRKARHADKHGPGPLSVLDDHRPSYGRDSRGRARRSAYGHTVRCSCGKFQMATNDDRRRIEELFKGHVLDVLAERSSR
jgi:hypothetical protein